MKVAYTVFFAVLSVSFFGFFALILCPLQALLMNRWPQKGRFIPVGQVIRRLWALSLLKPHCVKIDIEGPGAKLLPDPKGMVIVSNHQSALDILIHLASFHKNVAFFAKKELLRVPLFGWAAWLVGTVYIDRSKGIRNRESLGVLEKTLRNGGSVLIYPEGTRSKNAELLPFKRGAFVTAITLGRPLLPVCVIDSWKLMPKKAASIRSGRVRMYVGEPVPTEGLTQEDRFELAERLRNEISKHLDTQSNS